MDKFIELITQIKLPKGEDEATNELIEKLDEKAHEQGLSGAMELMTIKQSKDKVQNGAEGVIRRRKAPEVKND